MQECLQKRSARNERVRSWELRRLGDSGDAGNVAWVGAGNFLSDRVDLPFLMEKDVADQLTSRTRFGERNWAAKWSAWRALADFGRIDWQAQIHLPLPEEIARKPVEEEIKDLQTMALDERPDALGEIVAQKDEFISYFMTLMGGNSTTHSASFLVFNIANLVATLVVMHFKGIRDRPRPSHICPALLPPLEVPGHASYPSGHATQAHLFARCAKEMLPQQSGVDVALDALAARNARNREIAGLHYESDSTAGKHLAGAVFQILNDPAMARTFGAAMERAESEWLEAYPTPNS